MCIVFVELFILLFSFSLFALGFEFGMDENISSMFSYCINNNFLLTYLCNFSIREYTGITRSLKVLKGLKLQYE